MQEGIGQQVAQRQAQQAGFHLGLPQVGVPDQLHPRTLGLAQIAESQRHQEFQLDLLQGQRGTALQQRGSRQRVVQHRPHVGQHGLGAAQPLHPGRLSAAP